MSNKITDARKQLDVAIDHLIAATRDEGWFDGWRSSQPDIDGKLFQKSIEKINRTAAARKEVTRLIARFRAVLKAVRLTERAKEGR